METAESKTYRWNINGYPVYRIYDENHCFIGEYDTQHDFEAAWNAIAKPGYTYRVIN